jgi:hypothetical protein
LAEQLRRWHCLSCLPQQQAQGGTMWWDSKDGHIIAALCAYVGMTISLVHIIQHLRHYSEPVFQRYIVRIIFMVPMYSICSFPSLKQTKDNNAKTSCTTSSHYP